MVMNGHPGCCDCCCGEHHPSSPRPSPRLHGEAGRELSPARCDECEGCGTLCCGKQSRGRQIIPTIKPISLQEHWLHWAEAKRGKAPCVAISARTCWRALCPLSFLCCSRSAQSECHTAALGMGWLTAVPMPELPGGLLPPLRIVPGCRQVLLHQWVMPESLVPAPGTASLQPGNTATFVASTRWLTEKDRWDIRVHFFPARIPRY